MLESENREGKRVGRLFVKGRLKYEASEGMFKAVGTARAKRIISTDGGRWPEKSNEKIRSQRCKE